MWKPFTFPLQLRSPSLKASEHNCLCFVSVPDSVSFKLLTFKLNEENVRKVKAKETLDVCNGLNW